MKKLELKQNTQEWLDARKQYRTASEAAIVCGVSPWTSVADFKLIKAGKKQQYYSKAMQRGHELEDTVRQKANALLNMTFTEACYVRDCFMASLDGISADETTLIEIKVSKWTYQDIIGGKIPEYYWLQIQQQLFCSPAKAGYLVAMHPDTEDIVVSDPIYPEVEAMARIEQAWIAFDEMPVPEGPVDFTGNGEITELFKEYDALKRIQDDTKAEMDRVKATLIEKVGNQSAVVSGGYKITLKEGATRYDYKKAALDAGILLDDYATTGEPSFSITLPKPVFDAID